MTGGSEWMLELHAMIANSARQNPIAMVMGIVLEAVILALMTVWFALIQFAMRQVIGAHIQ